MNAGQLPFFQGELSGRTEGLLIKFLILIILNLCRTQVISGFPMIEIQEFKVYLISG
jgi:hypothetical protein